MKQDKLVAKQTNSLLCSLMQNLCQCFGFTSTDSQGAIEMKSSKLLKPIAPTYLCQCPCYVSKCHECPSGSRCAHNEIFVVPLHRPHQPVKGDDRCGSISSFSSNKQNQTAFETISTEHLSPCHRTLYPFSQKTCQSPAVKNTPISQLQSPSNYCRVATCEQLHIHDLTPKCLETFAPSSMCSSCQNCDKRHIGPNHDQVLLVSRLLKQLDLPVIDDSWNGTQSCKFRSTSLLMQWPLPEYRPQNSPDHLYKSIGF